MLKELDLSKEQRQQIGIAPAPEPVASVPEPSFAPSPSVDAINVERGDTLSGLAGNLDLQNSSAVDNSAGMVNSLPLVTAHRVLYEAAQQRDGIGGLGIGIKQNQFSALVDQFWYIQRVSRYSLRDQCQIDFRLDQKHRHSRIDFKWSLRYRPLHSFPQEA